MYEYRQTGMKQYKPKSFIFSRIEYKHPNNDNYGRPIHELIGFDSETYITGRPFLFCTSTGDCFKLSAIPNIFFTRKYRDCHFGVYNLKFDSGSILYNVPTKILNRIRQRGEAIHDGIKYRYIPHKYLRITKNGHGVTFWNVAQYFRCSLETAATKYLGKHKAELKTKSFTPANVKPIYDKIKSYCIQDAKLTAELYTYFKLGIEKIGFTPSALYSTASLSYQYFRLNSTICDVWEIWKHRKTLLMLACEAYAGGKFEIYKRGTSEMYEYDISSAYPYEISKLKSLDDAKLIFKPIYIPEADYGFLRVYIDNTALKMLPVAIKQKQLNIYPVGTYYATITKSMYEYMLSINIPIKIIAGFWVICKTKPLPYYDAINRLYELKEMAKGKDERQYRLCKILANGFYGKMAQLIPLHTGIIKAGNCWNPIHAATITANTRIKVCDISNRYPKNILAVHTDSVILNRPLPKKELGTGLGTYGFEIKGPGVLVSCGIYQIGDKTAFRGFRVPPDKSLKHYLELMQNKSTIKIPQLSVLSWVECAARNKRHLTNRFITEDKIFDVNRETKRIWNSKTTANKLLTTLENSAPPLLDNPPPVQ